MSKVNEFLKKLTKGLEPERINIIQWAGSSRRSNHLLKLEFESNSVVLYVKESNKTPGFWGLTKNQVDRLNSSKNQWFSVLLLRSNDSGYVLNSSEVNERIFDKTFELSRDGDYKVNENTDLQTNMTFFGIAGFLNSIKTEIKVV